MCTFIIINQPDHKFPVIIGANRDESPLRKSLAPARHWSERPEIIAGKDQLAGGTWLGVNDYGLFAGLLNRKETLGPAEGKRSRGELILEALEHNNIETALEALLELNPNAYQPFNLILASAQDAYWLKHDDTGEIEVFIIPEGLSMISASDLNDAKYHPRLRKFLPRFRIANAPDPEQNNWDSWKKLMARDGKADDLSQMSFHCTEMDFATVSASLIAIPADLRTDQIQYHFTPTAPHQAQWQKIDTNPASQEALDSANAFD